MYTKNLTGKDQENKFSEIYIDIPILNNFKLFSDEEKTQSLLEKLGKDKFIVGIYLHDFPKNIQLHYSFYTDDIEHSVPYALTLGVYLYEKYGIVIDLFATYAPLSLKTKKAIYKDYQKRVFEEEAFLELVDEKNFEDIIMSMKGDEDFKDKKNAFFYELREYLWELKNIADTINNKK